MNTQTTLLKLAEYKKEQGDNLSPELLELDSSLQDALASFKEKRDVLLRTGKMPDEQTRMRIEEQDSLIKEMCKKIDFLLDPETPLEKELNLREQYTTQMELLRKREGLLRVKDETDPTGKKFKNIPGTVGIVETLSDGREGYVAIDNKEYPAPTYEMIQQKFRERCESDPVFLKKFSQDFYHMLVVPKGAKLTHFVEQYESTLLERTQKGGKGLFLTGDTLDTPGERIDQCPKYDTERGVYVNEEYCEEGKKNNESGGIIDESRLLYGPTYEKGKIVGGMRKEDYLKEGTFPGWDILFVEKNINIPGLTAKDEEITKEGRTRLKVNKTAETYMKMLHEDPQYKGENGMTLEEWLTLANTVASTSGQVIDDCRNEGNINCLTGSIFVSGRVPSGSWRQGNARVNLNWTNPDNQNDARGLRPAVKM